MKQDVWHYRQAKDYSVTFKQTVYRGAHGRFVQRPVFYNHQVVGSFLIGIGFILVIFGIGIVLGGNVR